jgi:hypothetical protein
MPLSILIEPQCQLKKNCSLFPSLKVRSSGGLWSLSFPVCPSRSSAGLRLGDDGVNHSSDRGSVRTCARCREGSSCCSEVTGGRLTIKRCVLTTKLFQRKKDEAGVDSFRIEAIVSFSTTDALAQGKKDSVYKKDQAEKAAQGSLSSLFRTNDVGFFGEKMGALGLAFYSQPRPSKEACSNASQAREFLWLKCALSHHYLL